MEKNRKGYAMKRIPFLVLALALLLGGCGKSEFVAYEDSTEALIYEQETAFERLDTLALDGSALTTETLAAHELNLINVWATWCGYCIMEMPALEALSQRYDEVGFYGLLLQSDPRTGAVMAGVTDDERATAEALLAETGASYPQMLASEAMLPYLADIYSFPTTFFVDAEGRLVGEPLLGAQSEDQWEQLLLERLALLDE